MQSRFEFETSDYAPPMQNPPTFHRPCSTGLSALAGRIARPARYPQNLLGRLWISWVHAVQALETATIATLDFRACSPARSYQRDAPGCVAGCTHVQCSIVAGPACAGAAAASGAQPAARPANLDVIRRTGGASRRALQPARSAAGTSSRTIRNNPAAYAERRRSARTRAGLIRPIPG